MKYESMRERDNVDLVSKCGPCSLHSPSIDRCAVNPTSSITSSTAARRTRYVMVLFIVVRIFRVCVVGRYSRVGIKSLFSSDIGLGTHYGVLRLVGVARNSFYGCIQA